MRLLKLFTLAAAFILFPISIIFSQTDSSKVTLPIDSSGVKADVQSVDSLSSTPTVSEINNLFLLATKGQRDPFRIVSLVASKGDNAIPALEEFLFQPVDTTKDSTAITKIHPNKQYAIYTLDAIASQNAEELLKTVVLTHPDIDVKGLALKTLAYNVYYRIKNNNSSSQSLLPDKDLIHVLLQNADDTNYVNSCNETIGKISREGINNWTGEDYGDLPKNQENVKIAGNQEINIMQYREQWWQNNNSKINWNKNTNKFEEK